jgi:nucleoside-diphosphate-sugar epimerase
VAPNPAGEGERREPWSLWCRGGTLFGYRLQTSYHKLDRQVALLRAAPPVDELLVFGRGENPINFVSVTDVAHLIRHAAGDPALQGRSIDIGGPENMTFNPFARTLLAVTGEAGSIWHVPRRMLSMMLVVMRRVNPDLARKLEASLVMDTRDMTFDRDALQREFPDLPVTGVETAVRDYFAVSSKSATADARG